MKLKKIASLALAGLMAVSMLAGCGDNSSNGNNNVVVDPSNTSIVNAVNNGQNVSNNAKVTFSSSSTLDTALKKAIELYGDQIMGQSGIEGAKLKEAILNLSGMVENTPNDASLYQGVSNGFFDDTRVFVDNDNDGKDDVKLDGKTYTQLYVDAVSLAKDEQAALNMIAKKVDKAVADLDATTYKKASTLTGHHYYNYTYTGDVSLVSVTIDATNTPVYVYAYTITQTVAEKKL